jgi:hypothetical protein
MHDLTVGRRETSMNPKHYAGLAALVLLPLCGALLLLDGDRASDPRPSATSAVSPEAADPVPRPRPALPLPGNGTRPVTVGGGGETSRQSGHRLGDGRHPVRAGNFDSLLTAVDSLAGRELTAFRARYDGAIDFDSREEFDWLASNGYPLPEEILDAAEKSLPELEALAATGDEKAELLYFDRLNQEVLKARQRHIASGLDPATLMENREFVQLFIEADRYRPHIADNASPFVGYVLAEFFETALQNPYAAAGALYLSGSRGDHVAMLAADRVLSEYGIGEEARRALAAYSLVLRERDPRYYQPDPRPDGDQ